jgi:hypothetical protein
MEVEMKATVLRFTAMLAVVMAFTAASAYGQSTIKRQTFVVPLNSMWPAGNASRRVQIQWRKPGH